MFPLPSNWGNLLHSVLTKLFLHPLDFSSEAFDFSVLTLLLFFAPHIDAFRRWTTLGLLPSEVGVLQLLRGGCDFLQLFVRLVAWCFPRKNSISNVSQFLAEKGERLVPFFFAIRFIGFLAWKWERHAGFKRRWLDYVRIKYFNFFIRDVSHLPPQQTGAFAVAALIIVWFRNKICGVVQVLFQRSLVPLCGLSDFPFAFSFSFELSSADVSPSFRKKCTSHVSYGANIKIRWKWITGRRQN